MKAVNLRARIRNIPNFPKNGILFRDLTTLWKDSRAYRESVSRLAKHFRRARPEVVVGVESRGFIPGAALALQLGAGFVPARKAGKLPSRTRSASYRLEYGAARMEIHVDAIRPGQRVLLVDDLLATGGTMAACASLIDSMGGEIVGCGFLVELSHLGGRKKLSPYPVHSLVRFRSG